MPDNFSADDPQPRTEPVESAETDDAGADESGTADFDIDLGSYTAREEEVDIDLNFGGESDVPTAREDDLDIDFGQPVAEAEPEDEAEEAGRCRVRCRQHGPGGLPGRAAQQAG